jgi:hypothetical protein
MHRAAATIIGAVMTGGIAAIMVVAIAISQARL